MGTAEQSTTWRTFFPAIFIAMSALTMGAYAAYSPPERGQMAIVFAPGTSELASIIAVSRAGGSFVSPTRFSNVIIVFTSDKKFRRNISHYGGWFALAAAGLCSPLATTTKI